MRMVPGSIFRLPSGNVVQLVEVVSGGRLIFRYLQSPWNYTGRGLVLTLEWVRMYARAA